MASALPRALFAAVHESALGTSRTSGDVRLEFANWVKAEVDQVACTNRDFLLHALVGVTLKPWRPWLPLMQLGVIIANRHLDLRQTLFVEDFVLRDHLVQEEQVGRQRIDLIGGESPLIPGRHAAIDVIPHRRRKRRAQWQDALPLPDGNILAFFRLQLGRHPPPAPRAMAGDAPPLLKDLFAPPLRAPARRD